MKVLFMTNIPSPYRVEFFNELSSYCDLTVIYERANANDRNSKWKNKSNKNYKEIILESIKVGNDSSASLGAISHIKNNKYDVIVSGVYYTITSMITILYMHKKGIKFILSTDGGFIKLDSKIKYHIKKYFIEKASWYLSPSKNTDKYLINYGASANNIYRYPFTSIRNNEISKDILNDEKVKRIKEELCIKEKKVIVMVGQIIYRKGIDILIEAIRGLDDSVGVYVIGGEATEEYINMIKKYRLKNIYFIKFKEKKDLDKFYSVANLFILPTREDIWGLVINEAMAKGLPILTTEKCNAGVELIENGENGFVVEIENSIKMNEKIKEILDNPQLAKNIRNNNLKKITKYTIEKMALEHYEIFKKIESGVHL